ncbi:MAG: hypothetical protein HZB25_04445 [Candidatus Eisenbacteria bacterium]|nr:hypothetical protein [Candidatus Eisenbacteria bacterium]
MSTRTPGTAAFAAFLLALALCLALSSGAASAIQVRGLRAEPSRFSPNGDGLRDTCYALFSVDDTADVVAVSIGGSLHLPQNARTLVLNGPVGPGDVSIPWDGRSDLGSVVPEGDYVLLVQARRGGSWSEPVSVAATVDLTAPGVTNVSIQPNPYAPLAPGSVPPQRAVVRFDVSSFDTSRAGGDRALAWIERIPGLAQDFDDTLAVARSVSGDTVTFTAAWTPDASMNRDGVHTVHLETFDAAGNRGGGGFWSLDYALSGPALLFSNLPAPTRISGEIFYTYLTAYPDSIRCTAVDRHGVDSLRVRFGSGPWKYAALGPAGAWAVAFPDTSDPLHKEGLLTFDYAAISRVGYVTTGSRTLSIDVSSPVLTLTSPVPGRVARSLLVISGTCPATDTLYTTLQPSTGGTLKFQKLVTGGVFKDSLRLEPGINSYTIRGGDKAGNRSAVLSGSVEFSIAAGITAPEVFRAGDAFLAQLARSGQSLEVRIYRPDGSFVRRLFTDRSSDLLGLSYELSWDLFNESQVMVGRGPYLCVARLGYRDGSFETRRLAVVVMP